MEKTRLDRDAALRTPLGTMATIIDDCGDGALTNRMINGLASANRSSPKRPQNGIRRADWPSNCHCLTDVIMQKTTNCSKFKII